MVVIVDRIINQFIATGKHHLVGFSWNFNRIEWIFMAFSDFLTDFDVISMDV